jgi:hypothetical protein
LFIDAIDDANRLKDANVLTAVAVDPNATATNVAPCVVTALHAADVGMDCVLHVMPSVEIAARAPDPTAQNIVPFHAMSAHAPSGILLRDQEMPSGDVYEYALVTETAQNTVPFQASDDQIPLA